MKKAIMLCCLALALGSANNIYAWSYDGGSDGYHDWHDDGSDGTGEPLSVPEPSTLILLGTGLVCLARMNRKKLAE